MTINLPPIIHIVRRFGCVGGMESYVWNLTHELLKQDVQVEIICEETFGEFDSRILIHRVAKSHPRPRWKSMGRFRQLVTRYINDKFQSHHILIHSHERSNCHHVTTFHGPPIAKSTTFFHRLILSRRVSAWRQMEKDELLSASAKQILVVSTTLKNQLLDLYPDLASKKISIAHPGIHSLPTAGIEQKGSVNISNKFVFVGKEWKRKGLDLAVKILEGLPKRSTLDVFGPSKDDLPRRFINHPSIKIMGWRQMIPWEEYEVLIHPAKKEPFGMVVAEARSHGVKVLTSSEVGSVDLGFNDLIAIKPNAPLHDWVEALEELISKSNNRTVECLWTWSDLASLHRNEIYPKVLKALINDE